MTAVGRRSVLRGAAAAALSCVPAAALALRSGRNRRGADVEVGLQLFPLARRLRDDLDGTLSAVAAIGFRRVETAGLAGVDAGTFRAALDRHGLVCRSMHVPAQPWAPGDVCLEDDLLRVAADARVVGARTVVMPLFLLRERFDPARWPDGLSFLRAQGAALRTDDWERTAEFLDRTGSRLAALGLRLAYHNHGFEFAPLPDGRTGLGILMAGSDPETVGFELDAGWAAAAGVDVAGLLRLHRGRFHDMHVKNVARGSKPGYLMEQVPADLGEGALDWRQLLPLARETGVRGFYVEREPPFTGDLLALVAEDRRYLSTLAPRRWSGPRIRARHSPSGL